MQYVLIFIAEQMLLGGVLLFTSPWWKALLNLLWKKSLLLLCTCQLLFQGLIWHSKCASLYFYSVAAYFSLNLQVCVSERECGNDTGWRNLKLTWMCPVYKAIKRCHTKLLFIYSSLRDFFSKVPRDSSLWCWPEQAYNYNYSSSWWALRNWAILATHRGSSSGNVLRDEPVTLLRDVLHK